MPRKKVNTSSLTNALGASVLQWGIDNGFGDSTVSDLHALLADGKAATPRKAVKKPVKKAVKKQKAVAKKAAPKPVKKQKVAAKTAAPKPVKKQKAVAKKAAPKPVKKQKVAAKTIVETAPRRSKNASASDPNAVVKFIKKHGTAKAADLKGLVPDNANARSLFMTQLVEQKLIRREGKARGTVYLPA